MAPVYSTSRLRSDLYRLLDGVLETGIPLDIERRGRRLRIVPAEGGGRLDNLVPDPDYLAVDPDEIVHMDWSGEWRP